MKEITNTEFTDEEKLQYLHDIENGLANMGESKLLVHPLVILTSASVSDYNLDE